MTRFALLLALLSGTTAFGGERIRHEMSVLLEPARHRLEVIDRVVVADRLAGTPVEFDLCAALPISASDPSVQEIDAPAGSGLRRYVVDVPDDGRIELAYSGVIDFPLSEEKEEYTRGFRETLGFVGAEGVYLSASTSWYPRFDGDLIEFALDVAVPEAWHVISQGDGTSRGEDGRARWDSAGPTDDIYLVGGPLVLHRDAAGAVDALVYLHARDDALAAKYLTATAQYIEMYRALIGPYPYGKFALVENFWETGYGMPSFTLLGPTVIRFPFILHSSYPHEILHNWWGNSVFVDYESGNWCEGLTAYLADHLIQEQRGKGAEYRRGALQKYRDYVKEGRDFPLVEFRSRHSAATEAVGYGKALMLFHMLRRDVGDDAFRAGLARFYRGFKGRRASFRDIQTCFEAAAGRELGAMFDAWIERAGAPSLALQGTSVEGKDGGFLVSGVVEQTQEGEPFPLDVPIVVRTTDGEEIEVVSSAAASTAFTVRTAARPVGVDVDPEFDLFRLLDPRETPPSVGQLFGEERIVAVLPSAIDDDRATRFRDLVDGWRSESHAIEVTTDAELTELPADRAVWILGRENRLAATFRDGGPAGLSVTDAGVSFGPERASFAGHSIVVMGRHPRNIEKAIGWLIVGPDAAFAGIGRKLPHYGKYSYLAFEGDEPTNVIKGQWGAAGSPLSVDLRLGDGGIPPLATGASARAPLATLPPVFSQRKLLDHVIWLAAPEREGRGIGSRGLDESADYIAKRFEAAGLRPGGDAGGWFQEFTIESGPNGVPERTRNVIGVLPGSRADWREQSVILSAHYDHLGRGWPDARAGDEGTVHPGADDNASGVAVMIELASSFASAGAASRNLVFVAFSGEEAGRLGSKHFVAHPTPLPRDGIRGVINLDTVGRLLDAKLTILGTGTSREWPHIFMGCGYVTGVECANVTGSAEGSDQMSFIERGIPAVQVFTRAHGDYHRPTDTADKVDGRGLVRVCTFVKEALTYLTEREEPLTVTIDGAAPAAATGPGQREGRRVSFGTVPDFAFEGSGVKITSVVPDSPAARAGIQGGDVLVRIDEIGIDGLAAFSDALKRLEPGQTVTAVVTRGEERLSFEVTVVER